jgi:hypothetical protein
MKPYQELADHYGTVINPARVRKPKDKPQVEGTVGFLTRRIIADLQDEKFFTLEDLNQVIWERMDLLNAAPFTKKPGSREELFLTIEQKNLSPLPSVQFAYYERKQATVAPDFHVQFDRIFYSVPCKYIRYNVMIKATSKTVSVFTKDGTCIASHPRSIHPGQKLTHPDHLPVNMKEYSSWNRETFLSRTASIGPMTQEIVTRILASREFEVQAYLSCVGVLSLAGKYGKSILEQACGQALEIGIYSQKGSKTIINAIDLAMQEDPAEMQEDQHASDGALDQFYCCHDENHPKLFHQHSSEEEDAHDNR